MQQDTLIPLCRLYEDVSKAGNRYFTGTFTFTTKVVLLQNTEAKEGEPGWTLYISERTPKPASDAGGRGGNQRPT